MLLSKPLPDNLSHCLLVGMAILSLLLLLL